MDKHLHKYRSDIDSNHQSHERESSTLPTELSRHWFYVNWTTFVLIETATLTITLFFNQNISQFNFPFICPVVSRNKCSLYANKFAKLVSILASTTRCIISTSRPFGALRTYKQLVVLISDANYHIYCTYISVLVHDLLIQQKLIFRPQKR